MHICEEHHELLPDGIDPMPMPDTREEAQLLLLVLKLEVYPTPEVVNRLSSDSDRKMDTVGLK